jgi:L-methionine (R)-S-oxide reductase
MDHNAASNVSSRLLLGPFCGKPACQFVVTTPGKGRGVCADAFTSRNTIVVPDVNAYPGHIACDGDTKSEIVCPLILRSSGKDVTLGVFDLDCLVQGGFDDDDRTGLEKIAQLVVDACDW